MPNLALSDDPMLGIEAYDAPVDSTNGLGMKAAMLNLAPKAKIAEWHYNYGPNPFKLMVNKREAADIDDIYDYVCALAMYDMPDISDLNDPRLPERFRRNG